ncbi:hypothetical protein CPAR01_13235, partial [Colletotrichum paranaense]
AHIAESVPGQSLSLHQLSSLIIDVWFTVVQEKAWALTSAPRKPGHALAESPLSSVSDMAEDQLGEVDWDENVTGEYIIESSRTKAQFQVRLLEIRYMN